MTTDHTYKTHNTICDTQIPILKIAIYLEFLYHSILADKLKI
jgi:hypothetical protein